MLVYVRYIHISLVVALLHSRTLKLVNEKEFLAFINRYSFHRYVPPTYIILFRNHSCTHSEVPSRRSDLKVDMIPMPGTPIYKVRVFHCPT